MSNSVHPATPSATQPTVFAGGPRLLADVGGTNARFALETAPGRVEAVLVLACKDHATMADALRSYLTNPIVTATAPDGVRHAAIAIANPVNGDQVRMTNHHWEFSIEAVRLELDFSTFLVANDFTALAMALPHLSVDEKQQVGGAAARPGSAIGLIGAGTGLGVSGLVPDHGHWTPLQSEGGHVSFSPIDEREIAILRFAWRSFEHVSAERLMSGDGLELIYRALAEQRGDAGPALSAPEISRRALSGECALCVDVIDAFCGMLGTVAGNLAVTLGALGGIYIGGGIVPRLGEHFARSSFRRRFEEKGRFVDYLAQIPVYVITAEFPAFTGVSAILAEAMAEQG
ncbi:glucokinase [Janthinobacterium sp.]|uniref:glucokinase n=1 Tax=Janthinobacterium sp. TaxID=1871054 RepID=UPI00293D77A2|nr:glucokinase [Janthinobacterium sp.]